MDFSAHDASALLTLSDVQELVDVQSSSFSDQTVSSYCREVQTFKAEHIVKRINVGIADIRRYWPDATGPQLYIAFEMCQESIDDLIESIKEEAFRNKVARETERRLNPASSSDEPMSEPKSVTDDESDGDDKNDTDFVYRCDTEPSEKARRKAPRLKPPHVVSNLKCPAGVDPGSWAMWSEARKLSFIRGDGHPNAYYYRHLPKGETPRNGAWSAEEKKLFLKRMKQMRGNSDTFGHDWGLFSLAIPGRVGYQCSNFYRVLVESGEMYDSQYLRGEDGKLHHASRMKCGKITKKNRKKNVVRIIEPLSPANIESLTLMRRTEMERGAAELFGEKQQLSRYETWALQNPLPDMTDFITGEVIHVPAMAPSGYVLDYNTWLDILAKSPMDPFTNQHLTKRQLVVLTTGNIEKYADTIRKSAAVDE